MKKVELEAKAFRLIIARENTVKELSGILQILNKICQKCKAHPCECKEGK